MRKKMQERRLSPLSHQAHTGGVGLYIYIYIYCDRDRDRELNEITAFFVINE